MRVASLKGIRQEYLARYLPELEMVSLDQGPDVLFVRSAALHPEELPASLFAICRAGVGVDNLPLGWCSQNGVVVFNAPGANANSVKELVICALIASSRNLWSAWRYGFKRRGWDRKMLEKRRGQFKGQEISGKTLGVIGVGRIGTLVAQAAKELGMNVVGYDPYAPEKNFQGIKRADKIAELDKCHFITLHCQATDETREIINADTLALLRPGVVVLNFGREELVSKKALADSLKSGLVSQYWADFHDPDLCCTFPDNVATFPHFGALTEEAERGAQEVVARQFLNFWQGGAIENSVNFPRCQPESQRTGTARFVICNLNTPGVVHGVSGVIYDSGYNICYDCHPHPNSEIGSPAYQIIDIDNPDEKIGTILNQIAELQGVTKVRLINS